VWTQARVHTAEELFDHKILLLLYQRCISRQKPWSAISLLKQWLSYFLKKSYIEGNSADTIFFTSSRREDYLKLFNAVFETCPLPKSRVVWKYKYGINFSFLFLWFSRLYLFKFTKQIRFSSETDPFFLNKKISFRNRLFIYTHCIALKTFEKVINAINFERAQSVVVLSDTLYPERYFIKRAKSFGIKTVTLCHGIYNPNIDIKQESFLNYWNIDCDYVLSWGEGTSNLFKKYSPKAIPIECGYPLVKIIPSENFSQKIGVVLSVHHLRDQNQAMVNIVQRYAIENHYKVFLRVHPGDKNGNYTFDKTICQLTSDLNDTDIIICHTSAMLFTYLAQGKKVLKFRGTVSTYKVDERICFGSLEELSSIIPIISTIDFMAISRKEVCCIGEESLLRYKHFFLTLKKN